jgi:hypothetical protein
MKKLRWGMAGAALLLVLALFAVPFLLSGSGSGGSYGGSQAGEAQFKVANEQIDIYRGSPALGNSPGAVALATRFSSTIQKLRDAFFEKGNSTGLSASHHEFLTWCELQENQCVIIVHVPELRHFTDSAKESLGRLAWVTAQQTLQAQGVGRPGMKIAVGLRGFVLYDRVLIGTYSSNASSTTNGLIKTFTGSHPEERLFALFQPSPEPVALRGN